MESSFFEKINKTDKHLATDNEKKRRHKLFVSRIEQSLSLKTEQTSKG